MPDSSDPRPPEPEPGSPERPLSPSEPPDDPSGDASRTDGGSSGAPPRDEPPAGLPPYPGWTTGPAGGAAPSSGWAAPGGANPGPPSGPPSGSGQPWSGWTSGPTSAPGWGGMAPPPTGWHVPDVRPGVIALRPLGAGEIVDGAITTVRKNPMATLGLAAIVGVVTALVGLVASWILSNQDAIVDPTATADELLDALAVTLPVFGIELLISWLSTVFLTGMLTVVVGQAVIGRHLTIGEAWSRARPRVWRLVGLTIVYTLLWLGTFLGVILASVVLGAVVGGEGGIGIFVIGFFAALVLGVWLYVRFALAVPSLMLESETYGAGTRPVGLGRALGRSASLVRGSWWRTFGILLMIMAIGAIVTWAVNIPFQTIAGFALTDPASLADLSFGALVLASVGQVIGTAIAAPFIAAATVLLYIDLRIRREGLDLELARAAGIDLPGRGAAFDAPGSPPGSTPGSTPWSPSPGSPPPGSPPPGSPPPGSPPPGSPPPS